MTQADAWWMIRRRAADAGIETVIGKSHLSSSLILVRRATPWYSQTLHVHVLSDSILRRVPLELTEVRRLSIISMFSDDVLFERLVLKGGNALDLIYGVTGRGSVDIDFSLENDFEDLLDIERRIRSALEDRFDSKGYQVFDYGFRSIPPDHTSAWGGYKVEFKVIHKDTVQQLSRYSDPVRRLEQMRREATVTGPEQRRIFRIDISKNEFCQGKRETELDDYEIRVYSLEMIVIEKLRALCQQLEDYTQRQNRTARARDFFDVHAILTAQKINIGNPENVELLRAIFAAKNVPVDFLAKIEQTREFHRPDWPAVEATVFGNLKPFDYYFDFVVQEIRRLQALGVVNPPV